MSVTIQKAALVLSLASVARGCTILAPCEDVEKPAIALIILDSATQGPLASDSIIVVAVDGPYTDSTRFSNSRPDPVTHLQLARERPGLYDIRISAAGYRTWAQNDIRVRGGRCHVNTVDVTALLQRTPS